MDAKPISVPRSRILLKGKRSLGHWMKRSSSDNVDSSNSNTSKQDATVSDQCNHGRRGSGFDLSVASVVSALQADLITE